MLHGINLSNLPAGLYLVLKCFSSLATRLEQYSCIATQFIRFLRLRYHRVRHYISHWSFVSETWVRSQASKYLLFAADHRVALGQEFLPVARFTLSI
jgi:hypothetical protein